MADNDSVDALNVKLNVEADATNKELQKTVFNFQKYINITKQAQISSVLSFGAGAFSAYKLGKQIFQATDDLAKYTMGLNYFSQNIGMSTKNAQDFGRVIENIGGDKNKSLQYLSSFQSRLNALRTMGTPFPAQEMGAYSMIGGIDIGNPNKQALDLLKDISEKISAIPRSQAKTISEKMGMPEDVFNFVYKGKQNFEKSISEAEKANQFKNNQKQAEEYTKQKAILEQSYTDFLSKIGDFLMPIGSYLYKSGSNFLKNPLYYLSTGEQINQGASNAKDYFKTKPKKLDNKTISWPFKRKDYIEYKLANSGFSKEEVSSIMGNLMVENPKFDPKLKNPMKGSTATGIGQWIRDRQKVFEKLNNKSFSDSTLDDQVNFLIYELKHNKHIKNYKPKNLDDLTKQVTKYQFIGGTLDSLPESKTGLEKRKKYARQIYNELTLYDPTHKLYKNVEKSNNGEGDININNLTINTSNKVDSEEIKNQVKSNSKPIKTNKIFATGQT